MDLHFAFCDRRLLSRVRLCVVQKVIAVAHGVGGPAKAKATLARIDRGKAVGSSAPVQKCTAMQGGGPQWTSEIWYVPP